MDKLVIRHDDYDWRMDAKDYIAVHEEFKKRGLVETANMQFTQWGKLQRVDQELVNYINANKESYCIQIHGWGHFMYSEFEYDFIVRDLEACLYSCKKYFDVVPTIWYPPWNCLSPNMERAAGFVGLTIDTESFDIAKFIREQKAGIYKGHSVYFHAWNSHEMTMFIEMLDLAKGG